MTVPGVRCVIDSCLSRVQTATEGVRTVCASQAALTQRRGRCGREGPGMCLRLGPQRLCSLLLPHTPPAVLCTDLSHTLLQMKAMGIDDIIGYTPIALNFALVNVSLMLVCIYVCVCVCLYVSECHRFDLPTPPETEAVVQALEVLHSLGAVSESGAVTVPVGQCMAESPLPPRLSRTLIHSVLPENEGGNDNGADCAHVCCPRLVSALAAMLSVYSPFPSHMSQVIRKHPFA